MTIHTGFNDAWETPGWTAQNQAYVNSPEDVVTPLPTIRVHGHFLDESDRPLQVQVRAIPDIHVAASGDAVVLVESKAVSSTHGLIDFPISIGEWDWTFRVRVGPTTVLRKIRPVADVDLKSLLESDQGTTNTNVGSP